MCCFPLDLLRTRVLSAPGNSGAVRHPLVLLGQIAQREGIPALYVGLMPALIAMAPSGAIYYTVYDVLKERHMCREAQREGESVQ